MPSVAGHCVRLLNLEFSSRSDITLSRCFRELVVSPSSENRASAGFESSAGAGRNLEFWCALLILYVIFVGFSLLRVPVPGVNEPHYLCKAKYYWNPEWCAGDLFLESSNPHLVFYVTIGWLTRFLPLDEVAVVGRCLGLVPLAIGWQMLAFRLVGNHWASLISAGLFCILQSAGNWSGEWLVGGIESKVSAYGFLFWAIAQALALRLPSSALLAGIAISFHPVVGVWGALATLLATCAFVAATRYEDWRPSLPNLKTWCISGLLFCLTASPGIVLAGIAVFEGEPDESRIATYLQVSHRLTHHLDPMNFPKHAYRYFFGLIVLLLLLQPATGNPRRWRWWNFLVGASLLIALAGFIAGWGPRPLKEMPGYEWRMTILKFYPFRLADILVPVAVCLVSASRLTHWIREKCSSRGLSNGMLLLLSLVMTWTGLIIPGSETNPSRMTATKRQNWVAACQWIREHSDSTAKIYSFDNQWAVKWYAQRPEYVNFKDCPQDAASIVEWNERRWVISRWRTGAIADGKISLDELDELSRLTGTSIFVCDRFGPFEASPDHRNADFRVYKVRAK